MRRPWEEKKSAPNMGRLTAATEAVEVQTDGLRPERVNRRAVCRDQRSGGNGASVSCRRGKDGHVGPRVHEELIPGNCVAQGEGPRS